MKQFAWQTILGLAALTTLAPGARAELLPHVGYVYPAGGRQGATLQVAVGGQNLAGTNHSVHISGAGVQGRIVGVAQPMSVQELTSIGDRLKEMGSRKPAESPNSPPGGGRGTVTSTNATWTAADEQEYQALLKKIRTYIPPNQLVPALADTATIEVTIAPEAAPGEREIRLGTAAGLSNPLRFQVGQLPEFTKPPSKIIAAPFNSTPETRPTTPKFEMNITLPAVVNGQIMPGGVDTYRFPARKGQRLVINARARELIPFLSDAVPGWFQATLALRDAKGKELAYDDDFRFRPDPALYYQIPDDGEYAIEIRDAIYRGRQDFVYRVTLGELPFITSIFPLGGPAGKATTVELRGWNLPVTNLTTTPSAPGINFLAVSNKDGFISNPVPFAANDLPECLEQELNDLPGRTQPVTLPLIVNGRIDRPGDEDVFSFEGRAGDQIVAEVYARRLDSSLDSTLRLTDASGKQLAFNDDHEDKGSGLNTHHADSYLTATLPANGKYYLHLTDAQHKGGPEYAYRLRLSAPRPDYALRVTPSSINVRGGRSAPITVYVLRQDGFADAVSLGLKDAPPGVVLDGGRVPANQDVVRVTVTAPPEATKEPIPLHLQGQAMIRGQAVIRPAVPAEDMMQAFAYRHLVPVNELDLVILGGPYLPKAAAKFYTPTPLKLPAGGTARLGVTLYTNGLELTLLDPPDGITIEEVAPSPRGAEIVLRADANKVKPGLEGNLILNISFTTPKAKMKLDKRITSIGTLPAVPFAVVAQSANP